MSHRDDDVNPNESDIDPFIDSLLEERLGGKSPPDLANEILARLEKEKSREKTLVSARRTAHARQYKSARSNHLANRIMVVVALATMAAVIGMIAWNGFPQNNPVASSDQPTAETNSGDALSDGSAASESIEDGANDPRVVSNEKNESQFAVNENVLDSDASATSNSPESNAGPANSVVQYFAKSKYDRSALPSNQDDFIAALNQEFRRQWQKKGITPSEPALDEEWLARVFEDLIGRQPNQNETADFARSRSTTKRTDVVAALTSSDEYADDFHLQWSNVLNSFVGDDRSNELIATAVKRNTPYDQLVRQLVADSINDVDNVCRMLLGSRSECSKCHSELGPPADHIQLLADGLKQDRTKFAHAVAYSDETSELFVNKMWAHFFAARLTPAVGMSGPSAPSLKAAQLQLTQQFIASGYDTRKLAAWIVLSEPFGLSDHLTTDNQIDSAIAAEPMFARYYSGGQFANSIEASLTKFAAADIDLVGKNADAVNAVASLEPRLKTNANIKNDENIWNAVEFMNSDPDRANILIQHKEFLGQLAKSQLRSRERVEHIFLTVVGRPPTPAELKPALKIVRSQKTNAMLGLRDVWWAISKGR